MFSRKDRVPVGEFLRDRPETLYVSPVFALKAKPNRMGHNRYGVVVGAAVEPKAVRRYRLKRQIAEAARAWPPVSLDCVFIFSRVANQLSSLELRAELERAREAVSGFSARRRPTQQ